MALTLENPNLVWQRAFLALDALGATPSVKEALRKLKERLATVGPIKNLQFVPIADLTADAVIADAACTFYFAYFKKQNTATDAYVKLNDSATTAGGANGGSMTDCVYMPTALDEVSLSFPKGRVMASGIAAASQTTAAGNTDSTAGDGPNGFVILGA